MILQGVGGDFVSVPLHQISLNSEIVCRTVIVGVVDSLPMQGISMLLGNDLAGERVVPHPRVVEKPMVSEETEKIEQEHPGTFPSCVVTRAEAKKMTGDVTTRVEGEDEGNEIIDLSQTCLNHELGLNPMLGQTPSSNPNPQEEIVDVAAAEQREDNQITPLFEESLSEEELNQVPSGYFVEDDILMRKWRPPHTPAQEDWSSVHQLVLPRRYKKCSRRPTKHPWEAIWAFARHSNGSVETSSGLESVEMYQDTAKPVTHAR